MRTHKTFKRTLSLLLCVMMLLGSALADVSLTGITVSAAGNKIADYTVGDVIEFGWYPQSKVTDESVISALNTEAGDNKNWTSYNYYSGTGNYDDGKMTASDYMRYTDIVLGENKYRGVVFDSYRPYFTGYTSSSTYQDDNGYNTNTVYWFKFEPIKWRVLDPSTGMVMSETILDSQAYNNYVHYSNGEYYGNSDKTYYANNYAESSIREWLNNDFYNTAFSASQKEMIATTTLDNSAYSTDYSKYDSATSDDKIYLLSYADSLNTIYGFSTSDSECDFARIGQGSDYAKSQGLGVNGYSGNSYWYLRSAGYNSFKECGGVFAVRGEGCVSGSFYASRTHFGVRPALNLKSEAVICNCKIEVPSATTITYGAGIILHASAENLPSGAKIIWEADNGNFSYSVSSDGTTCTITPKTSGDTVFIAKIVDKDGNEISSATQKMTSKAGLWQKIVAFFKNLFSKNQVIPYAVRSLLF